VLQEAGIETAVVNKVKEGRPHTVDMLKNGEIDLIVNTTEGRQAIADSSAIRRTALQNKVFYSTTLAGADAVCQALTEGDRLEVRRLQDVHQKVAG
jgi:carbamoyl-phosphate synthase large subunit